MKNKLRTIALISTVVSLVACGNKSTGKKTLEKVNVTTAEVVKITPTVETVFASETIRPGNLAITKNGRLFVSMNPLVGPETKVFELNKDAKNVGIGYPNAEYATGENSSFKAIVAVRADKNDNLWILDLAVKQFTVWDTNQEKLVKTIQVPADVVLPTSFLQDFIIDEKHNRVIIADMTQGDLKSAPLAAFIVIDTETGKAKRMAQNHPSMLPELEGGFALNPIAIDPAFEWIYFGALHGKKVYRVPASSFDSEEELVKNIAYYAPKSFCDGIAVDKNQNVYITNIEESAIGVTNPKDGFRNIANLPEGQSWPDGLYIPNDGYVYATVDQLNRTAALNKGEDISKGPFLVVKTKLVN